MKKWYMFFVLMVLFLQAIAPAASAKAQTVAKDEMPAGLHLALMDSMAADAAPLVATAQAYVIAGHGLDVHLKDGRFSAEAQEQSSWRFDLHLSGIGRGEQVESLQPTGIRQDEKGRVEYRYPGLVEWYRNTTLGIQQGFTLSDKPQGSSSLVLRIELTTDLEAVLSEDERSLSFDTGEDGQMLRYAYLRAFDAQGRELATRLH